MKRSNLVFLIAAILAGFLFIAGFIVGLAQAEEDTRDFYTNVAVVSALDTEHDLVVCEDSAGLLWAFYGVEDWSLGDCVCLLMDTQGTDYTVLDDMVISARYCAWNVR